jgi:hypothetical protein
MRSSGTANMICFGSEAVVILDERDECDSHNSEPAPDRMIRYSVD